MAELKRWAKKMSTGKLLSISLALLVAGCTENSLIMAPAKKEALRKTLAPKFVVASVPTERGEDFFGILEAFNAGRRKNEFVRSVGFTSGAQATLEFDDGGMHGGGTASARKKDGKWIIDQKLYFM